MNSVLKNNRSGENEFQNSLLKINLFAVAIIFMTVVTVFSASLSTPYVFITLFPLLILQFYLSSVYHNYLGSLKKVRCLEAEIYCTEFSISGIASMGMAVRSSFFLIMLCFDFTWLFSAYINPSAANSFQEYLNRLQFGFISGEAFLIFTIFFWITYIFLYNYGAYFEKDIKASKRKFERGFLQRVEFSFKVQTYRNEDIRFIGYRIPNFEKQPLILIPGFSQNGTVYDLLTDNGSLAEFLWRRGYDIWIFHPRGTGLSGYSKNSNSLDDYACDDIPSIINFVSENTKVKPYLVGHSQGGITSIMSLMGAVKNKNGEMSLSREESELRQSKLKGLITFGSLPDFKFSKESFLRDFVRDGLKIKGLNITIKSESILKSLRIFNRLPVPVSNNYRKALLYLNPLSVISFPLKFILNIVSQLKLWKFLYHIPNVSAISRKYLFYLTIDGTFQKILSQYYYAIKYEGMRSSDNNKVNYTENYDQINLPVSFVGMEFDTLADPQLIREILLTNVSSKEKYFTEWKGQGHEDFFMNPEYFKQVYDAINSIDKREERVSEDPVANLLAFCEERNPELKYIVDEDSYKNQKTGLLKPTLPVQTKPVEFNSNGEEIFVVSDLHIASGKNSSGIYRGTENFFADESFSNFLKYANENKRSDSAILIINGDVFDFMRVVEYPGRVKETRFLKMAKDTIKMNPVKEPVIPSPGQVEDEFEEWQRELAKVGIKKSIKELEDSISDIERAVGLRTNDFKSVYKFNIINKGHSKFFEALGQWIKNKNKIFIIKGNHDLEWYWSAVRNYFRLIIGEKICSEDNSALLKILEELVIPNIRFYDDSVLIDNVFLVEHGHRYDKFTMVLKDPIVDKYPDQLNIPFGSFFNRYLLNRIELFYPFIDNVRPAGNLLPILMRENFPLGLKVLFQHIPLTSRILFTNARYVRFMFNKVFWFVFFLILPIAAAVYLNFDLIKGIFLLENQNKEGIGSLFFDQLIMAGSLLLSYILARVVSWFQLTEPSSLDKYAKTQLEKNDYKLMTMGHTHNPGQYYYDLKGAKKKFYNTGTWIPVIENSNAEVRNDKTFTFLYLDRDENKKLRIAFDGMLLRWNDDALRAEPQILVERK